jgi:hypothetical protein
MPLTARRSNDESRLSRPGLHHAIAGAERHEASPRDAEPAQSFSAARRRGQCRTRRPNLGQARASGSQMDPGNTGSSNPEDSGIRWIAHPCASGDRGYGIRAGSFGIAGGPGRLRRHDRPGSRGPGRQSRLPATRVIEARDQPDEYARRRNLCADRRRPFYRISYTCAEPYTRTDSPVARFPSTEKVIEPHRRSRS